MNTRYFLDKADKLYTDTFARLQSVWNELDALEAKQRELISRDAQRKYSAEYLREQAAALKAKQHAALDTLAAITSGARHELDEIKAAAVKASGGKYAVTDAEQLDLQTVALLNADVLTIDELASIAQSAKYKDSALMRRIMGKKLYDKADAMSADTPEAKDLKQGYKAIAQRLESNENPIANLFDRFAVYFEGATRSDRVLAEGTNSLYPEALTELQATADSLTE